MKWRTFVLRLTLVLSVVAFLSATQIAHADATDAVTLAHKLGVRLGSGIYQTSGSTSGSTMAVGGLSAIGNYFISPRFSLSFGYRAEFDFSNQNIPLRGMDLGFRRYFKGEGTRVTRTYQSITSETVDRTAWYFGAEFIQRHYYIPGIVSTNLNIASLPELNGEFYGINATVGMDYRLGRDWELTVDASYGLMTFAASDEQIKIKGMLLNLGISYLW